MVKPQIEIEVVYVGGRVQSIIPLLVGEGTTLVHAIEQSNILLQCPEIGISFSDINLLQGRVGIFGKVMPLNTLLKAGDRVEIYQPLKRDPKAARRERAKGFRARLRANKAIVQRNASKGKLLLSALLPNALPYRL